MASTTEGRGEWRGGDAEDGMSLDLTQTSRSREICKLLRYFRLISRLSDRTLCVVTLVV